METSDNPYVDFVITVRKYKTRLTAKYLHRPLWTKPPEGQVSSALPGTVLSIAVSEGQRIEEGRLLLTLEAMKMENRILAPLSGTVGAIHVKEGDTIGRNHPLATIIPG
ncbi:MAG: acetyl-CoA carboxylase biotin carboxyl carrier protein subunit [Tannerellaceae bacterium]|jgi:pyruvate carboxylase subunit B|nr:acetyl-CoA carboxylase biotin carboxyl carrier protein subunit [Tannerellaceae bacterium]